MKTYTEADIHVIVSGVITELKNQPGAAVVTPQSVGKACAEAMNPDQLAPELVTELTEQYCEGVARRIINGTL